MSDFHVAVGGGFWDVAATYVENSGTPGLNDNVFCTVLSGNLSIRTYPACNNFDCTGYLGVLAVNAYTIDFYGNVKFVSTMSITFVGGGWFVWKGMGAARTFDSGTLTIAGALYFYMTGGKVSFITACTTTSIISDGGIMANATLDFGGQIINCQYFTSTSTTARTFIITGMTMNCSIAFGFQIIGANATITDVGGTSTINLTSPTTSTFNGGGKTYGIITNNGTSAITFSNADTIATLTITGNKTTTFAAATTVTNFTTNGSTVGYAGQTITNTTISGSATITFAGANNTFPLINITYTGISLTLIGNNTFNQLNLTGGSKTLYIAAGSTQYFNSAPNIIGTGSITYTIQSSSTSAANLVLNSAGLVFAGDYLNISYLTVSGGVGWWAGKHSTDSGHNVNWNWGSYFLQILSDSLTLSDSKTLSAGKSLSDSLTLSDLKNFGVSKVLSDNPSLSDSLKLTTTKMLFENISLLDSLKLSTTKVLSDYLGMLDNKNITFGKVVSDNISLSDSKSLSTAKVISDSLMLADSKSIDFGKTLSDSLGISDSKSFLFEKNISDFISVSDDISKETGKYLDDYLTVSDDIRKEFEKYLTDDIGLSDLIVKEFIKTLQDNLDITDYILISKIMTLLLSDSLTVSDSASFDIDLVLYDILTLSDEEVISKYSSYIAYLGAIKILKIYLGSKEISGFR